MQMHHLKRCLFSLHGYLLYIEQALRLILQSIEEKQMEIVSKKRRKSAELSAIMTGHTKSYTRTVLGSNVAVSPAAGCRMQDALRKINCIKAMCYSFVSSYPVDHATRQQTENPIDYPKIIRK